MLWGKMRSFWPDIIFTIIIFYFLIRNVVLGKLVWGISPYIWMVFLTITEVIRFIHYKTNL